MFNYITYYFSYIIEYFSRQPPIYNELKCNCVNRKLINIEKNIRRLNKKIDKKLKELSFFNFFVLEKISHKIYL